MQAHRQVVECRRILKWTYAYGFYRFDTIPLEQDAAEENSDDEGGDGPRLTQEERAKAAKQLREMKNRKEFFEFLQGDAETALERLSDTLEKDLTRYYSREEFWREKGMHRIAVQPSHFVSDVQSRERCLTNISMSLSERIEFPFAAKLLFVHRAECAVDSVDRCCLEVDLRLCQSVMRS
jgi:hypothetical protein